MGYRLLLADDSITIQKVVELVLSPEGYEIRSFNDGEQALAEIGSYKPHIVLADIEMPKLNGYQLCERIKDNPALVHIPVILLAGAFEPFDEEQAKKVGADDYIIKPFESQELISKVKALVKDLPEQEVQQEALPESEPEKEDIEEEDPFAMLKDMPVTEQEQEPEETPSDITFSEDDLMALQKAEQETETQEGEGETFKDVLNQAMQKEEETTTVETPQPDVTTLSLPSKDELAPLIREALDERLRGVFDEAFRETLVEVVKEKTEELIRQTASSVIKTTIEQLSSQVLSAMANDIRDNTVSMLNRVIPETARELIEREIKKITAEL